MIFLYSSELHLSHAGLVYILADFGANLLIGKIREIRTVALKAKKRI
jgi:hypothetical protein